MNIIDKANEVEKIIISKGFNGSVSIVYEDQVIVSKGFGYANFEHDIPNTNKTKFRIASITKQFTACAILQLQEKGLLDVNDTIDHYISDFPNGDQITIHHLLTHTSGISNFELEADFYEVIHSESVQDAAINLFKHLPLQFEPGTQFSYSVSGYLLLGQIIENLSGMAYEDYLKKYIFDPLKMNASGFDHASTIVKGRASGYEIEDGTIKNTPFFDMRIAGAGGGLYSSIEDLCTFNNALLSGNIISQTSLNLMFKDQFSISEEDYSGYGIFLETSKHMGKSRRKYYHAGGGIGVRSMNIYLPDDHLRITMVSNVNDRSTFNSTLGEIESALVLPIE